jgi:signal transduction histidine kinase
LARSSQERNANPGFWSWRNRTRASWNVVPSGESGGTADAKDQDLHDVALRVASLKVVFAILSLVLVGLSAFFEEELLREAVFGAFVWAGFFVVWCSVTWVVQRQGLISTAQYSRYAPILEVVIVTQLILLTGGFTSPFVNWFAFGVVTTAMIAGTTTLAIVAGLSVTGLGLIAVVSRVVPSDVPLLIVRTSFLLGFAWIVAYLTAASRNRQIRLAAVERFGAALSSAKSEADVEEALRSVVEEAFGSATHSFCINGQIDSRRSETRNSHVVEEPIYCTGEMAGELRLSRAHGFSIEEIRWVRLIAERLGSWFARQKLASENLEAVVREERANFADQIHDGYIQTLTAMQLYASAAEAELGQDSPRARDSLQMIRQLASDAAEEARELLLVPSGSMGSVEVLEALIRDRWNGQWTLLIDEDVLLDPYRWQVIEMLVKEGLNNARRHGGATKVRVHVARTPSQIIASVQSDGASPSVPVPFGYGLSRLQSVAKIHGGEVFLEPIAAGGAVLYAVFDVTEKGEG